VGTPFLTASVEGPAPEVQVVRDMLRRALPAAPVLVLVCLAMRSVEGGLSSLYGLAIVVGNLVLSAALLAWSARISLAFLMGAALFGFLIRLGLIFLAVMLVKDAAWVDVTALGITLVVAHLGLLFWEMRYVSLSLAHPGVKPDRTRRSSSDVHPEVKESVAP
jgi:branched-subunit amino acid transport protein AzlD